MHLKISFSNFLCSYEPDTWGTITDIATFFLTLITLVGLYYTLKSQNKTLKLQLEQNKADSIQRREGSRPYLKFAVKPDSNKLYGPDDFNKTLRITIIITNVSNNVATNVDVKTLTNNFARTNYMGSWKRNPPDQSVSFEVEGPAQRQEFKMFVHHEASFQGDIVFSDIYGFSYITSFQFYLGKTGPTIMETSSTDVDPIA